MINETCKTKKKSASTFCFGSFVPLIPIVKATFYLLIHASRPLKLRHYEEGASAAFVLWRPLWRPARDQLSLNEKD